VTVGECDFRTSLNFSSNDTGIISKLDLHEDERGDEAEGVVVDLYTVAAGSSEPNDCGVRIGMGEEGDTLPYYPVEERPEGILDPIMVSVLFQLLSSILNPFIDHPRPHRLQQGNHGDSAIEKGKR